MHSHHIPSVITYSHVNTLFLIFPLIVKPLESFRINVITDVISLRRTRTHEFGFSLKFLANTMFSLFVHFMCMLGLVEIRLESIFTMFAVSMATLVGGSSLCHHMLAIHKVMFGNVRFVAFHA